MRRLTVKHASIVGLLLALSASGPGCDCVGYELTRFRSEASDDEGDPDADSAVDPCDVDPRSEGCPCDRGATPWKCYDGPEETASIGSCHRGMRRCLDGYWSACEREVVPREEICNWEDDDCDGVVDEGVQNECGSCGDVCVDPSFDSHDPLVAMDGLGNATLVWTRNTDVIVARRHEPGVGWGEAAVLGLGTHARLAVNDSGEAIVTFTHSDDGDGSLMAARYDPTDGWGAAEVFAGPGLDRAYDVGVALDPSGVALARWQEGSSPRKRYAFFEPDLGWTEARDLEDVEPGPIVAERGGGFLVLGSPALEAGGSLWAWNVTPEGGFGEPTRVSTPESEWAWEAAVGPTATDDAVALWRAAAPAGSSKMCSSRREADGLWSEPVCGAFEADRLTSLAVGEDGGAVIGWGVWVDTPGVRGRSIRVATLEADGWEPKRELDGPYNAVSLAGVARGGDGRAVAVWVRTSHVSAEYLLECGAENGDWGEVEVVEGASLNGTIRGVQVAMAPDGSHVVAWEQREGGLGPRAVGAVVE